MANELKEKHQRLKKVRTRNIVLNSICILLAGSGIWWTANYFWRYINYEVTNDAFVDQYIAPLNIRASGYIKEVRFKEHQYVHQGDTLLILDDREYRIKVKEAEAALIDAQGSQDVLRSGIETSHTNIAVQDANIAEAKAKLWQLEQDYHRFERLLKEESVGPRATIRAIQSRFRGGASPISGVGGTKESRFLPIHRNQQEDNRSRGGDLTKRSGSGFSEVKPFLYRYNRPLRRSCRQTDLRARTIRASRTNDILPRTR